MNNRNNNSNNNNRQRNRRPRRARRNRRRNGRNVNQNQQMILSEMNHTRVPRSLHGNEPFPPQMTRRMRYTDPVLILKNAAASFALREFKLNDLFDPDPLLGGGSVSGYTQLSQIYNRNLVTHVEMNFSLVNIEPTAVIGAYLIFRDRQPSTFILSYNDAISSTEVAPCTRPIAMGVSTGNPRASILRKKIALSAILGRPLEYLTNEIYTSTSNTSPAQVMWGALVIFSFTPLTLIANGVTSIMSIDFTTKWYSGQNVLQLDNPLYLARERYIKSFYE